MPRSTGEIVRKLEAHRALGSQLTATLRLPAEPEACGELNEPLPEALQAALQRLGVARLWSHQAAGLEAVRSGRNTLVTTPTASGKSLVFHLPPLEEEIAGGDGRALFLYPLKALGQDQRSKILKLAGEAGLDAGPSLCAIYDGDTPESERQRIKRSFPRIIISNPDMLHLGILGSWHAWEPFLRDLRWIVLDELHTYRGIFGSHFHHVLQRLTRICRELGSKPVVVASSATAANAGEFADTLCGQPFEWVRESGAPRAGRSFLLFRPSASPYTLTLDLFAELLRSGLKTIVFTKARRITELLISWFRQQEPELATRVAGYRSGFLPSERRQIEADLFSGRLDGVISTSALEMGVDVGGLDACILVGFPGSVIATWQRSGRVGRGERESLTALVALPDALDQYFLLHPEALIERPCEQLIVDPVNEPVSRGHLVCAAAEKPLDRQRDGAYLEPLKTLVDQLIDERLLEDSADGREIQACLHRPHRDVSLRGAGESTTIVDAGSGRVVGTVDGVRVLHECHPGAIYLHQGRQYLARELDLATRRVVAEPVSVDYYTTPLTEKDTAIQKVLEERRDGALAACLGRLRVTERVTGYERRRIRGQDVLGQHELELPPVSYETVGLWWVAPSALEEELRSDGFHFMGALHAAEHATISLLPLFAICDRGDIGGISIPLHDQLGCGAVFVYDGHPGGVGIAARAFADLPELLERVLRLVTSCDCEDGCPSCIQSPKCGNGNRPLDREGARRFLDALLTGGVAGDLSAAPIRPAFAGSESPVRSPVEAAGLPVSGKRAGKEARAQPPSRPENPARTMLVEVVPTPGLPGSAEGSDRRRLAAAAVCHLEAGRIEVFDEDEVLELVTLLESADLVVGHGLARVVYPVLSAYTGIDYGGQWASLELDLGTGTEDGLERAASASLGAKRGGPLSSGGAPLEISRSRLEALRDLYLFGRRMGVVRTAGADGDDLETEVDW